MHHADKAATFVLAAVCPHIPPWNHWIFVFNGHTPYFFLANEAENPTILNGIKTRNNGGWLEESRGW